VTFSFVELRNPKWSDPSNRRKASFRVSGSLMDNNLVMVDLETRTTWPQLYAIGHAGPQAGSCLILGRNTVDTTWRIWRALHPETLVLTNQNEEATRVKPQWYDTNPYKQYWETGLPPVNPVWRPDPRFAVKQLVYGLHTPLGPVAIIPRGAVMQGDVGGLEVVVFQDPPSRTVFAFENIAVFGTRLHFSEAEPGPDGLPRFRDENTGSAWTLDGIAVAGPLGGTRLGQLPGLWVYWFAWASFFPMTTIHGF